jgi:hypothetical protein
MENPEKLEKLIEIANTAVADYGFRQIVQWSPDDVAVQWQLSPGEVEVLKGRLKTELDQLPIPVEPHDVPGEQERLAGIIKTALS